MTKLRTLISLTAAAAAAAVLALAPLAAGAGEAGMAQKDGIKISGAWIRAALPNRPTAAYMTLENAGEAADRLVAARSEAFETVEIHESKMKDGVMSMSPIPAVDVAAGGMAMLKPGGKHLMLFGGKGLKEGKEATMTLVFESAGEITLTLPVRKGGGHGTHGKAKE